MYEEIDSDQEEKRIRRSEQGAVYGFEPSGDHGGTIGENHQESNEGSTLTQGGKFTKNRGSMKRN